MLQGQADAGAGDDRAALLRLRAGPAQRDERGRAVRARALLDLHGFVDRDGDGWRERPDGSPLLLRRAFPPDQRSRQQSELWAKRMRAVGLRMQFEMAPFSALIKRSLAGQLMMWGFSWGAGNPDGDFFLGLAYGPNAEQSNDARFRLAAFDRLYERQRVLPDGPERLALMHQATRLMLAYVPYIAHAHPYRQRPDARARAGPPPPPVRQRLVAHGVGGRGLSRPARCR